MELKKDIIEQTRYLQEFIVDKVAKSESGKAISNQEARLINEALFALSSILDYCKFEPHNKVIIQKTYRLGLDLVYEKLFYYSAYYYSYGKISRGEIYEQQEAFFQINVNTATAISVFEGYRNGISGIGGSTDDYYIERMPRVLWSLENVLKYSKGELIIPSLYVSYNLSQSLSLYLNSGHESYKNDIIELLNKVLKIQEQFHSLPIVQHALSENLQLELFRLYQFSIAQKTLNKDVNAINLNIPSLKDFKVENSLRVLGLIYYFDKELFISLFDQKYTDIIEEISKQRVGLNTFLFIKCLAQYCSATNIDDKIDFSLLPLQKDKLDFSDHINNIFNNYHLSASEILLEGDLERLLAYNDNTLREKVANTITGVDLHILSRESKKPHGVSEISDMEIPIKLDGKPFYMCMPFKSGLEISGNSVPENIAYQIFRPFLHFDNCVVVFITAKRSSQNLMNYIKRMQSKLGWNIYVIENEELAKLLKTNGQLN